MPIVESKKRNSILGSLALLLAFGALGLSVFDVAGLPPVSVGPWNLPFALACDAGVAAFALIALLLAGKSVRTGTEIPGAALVVALAAGGVFYIRHRAPPTPIPARQTTPAAAPAVATQPPPKVPANAPGRTVVPSVSNVTDAAKNVTKKAAEALTKQQQLAALNDAKSKFATAQARVIGALKTDPIYLRIKAKNDAADLQLRDARLSYPAADPTLVAISQSALTAKDALNQYVADAVAKDPDAAAAKAKLDALTQPNP